MILSTQVPATVLEDNSCVKGDGILFEMAFPSDMSNLNQI